MPNNSNFDPDDLIPDGDDDDTGNNQISLHGIGQVANASYPQASWNPFQLFSPATPPATISTTDPYGRNVTLTLLPGRDGSGWDYTHTQQYVAYKAPDGSITIGIQGTNNVPNLITDAAVWGAPATSVLSPALDAAGKALFASDLYAAAQFVQQVQADNPGAQISLTGHSLGGAVAQLVGYYMNIPATALNAPGVGKLADSTFVNSILNGFGDPNYDRVNSPSPSVNISLQGDLVHLTGDAFGTQGTLTPGSGYSWDTSYGAALTDHFIDTLLNAETHLNTPGSGVQLIQGDPASGDPVLGGSIDTSLQYSNSDGSEEVDDNDTSGDPVTADPSAGGQFLYKVGAGSVPLATLYLPGDGHAIAGWMVATESNGTWSAFQRYAPGTPVPLGASVQAFTFEAVDGAGNVIQLPANYLFFLKPTGPGHVLGSISTYAVGTVRADVSGWFSTILREATTGSPDAALAGQLNTNLANNSVSPPEALQSVLQQAENTTSVATLAYEFFTGSAPSAAGMDYLISPTGPNSNNLNSAYYQHFNIQNRYINFAVNLGKLGQGNAWFSQNYGALDIYGATAKAYHQIFGTTPNAATLSALIDTVVDPSTGMTRGQYFSYYGGDGLNGIGTKAAIVGWLLSVAATQDVGLYAKSNDAYLLGVATGQATYSTDFVSKYAGPAFLFPSLENGISVQDAVGLPASWVGQLSQGLLVADTSANIQTNLDKLNTMVVSGELDAVRFLDATPSLTITPAQLGSDLNALMSIDGLFTPAAFALNVSGTVSVSTAAAAPPPLAAHVKGGLQVSDAWQTIFGQLKSLEALAKAGDIGAIALTGSTPAPIAATAAQVAAAPDVLPLINSAYALQVTGPSAAYAGATITHLSTSGSFIDITDLSKSTASLSYTPAASGASGTLNVSDGFHNISVKLVGTYTQSHFSVQSDGHGGTEITYS